MTGFTNGCPVCAAPRPLRRNYTRPATCTAPACVLARKAHGGRQGRGRPKPGLRRTNALKRYWRTGAAA